MLFLCFSFLSFSTCEKMHHQLNGSTDYILKYHLIKLMMVVFVYQNLQIIKQLETNNTVKMMIQYCNNALITLKLYTFNQYSQQFTWSVMYLWIERKREEERRKNNVNDFVEKWHENNIDEIGIKGPGNCKHMCVHFEMPILLWGRTGKK